MPRICYRVRAGVQVRQEEDGQYRLTVPASERDIRLQSAALAPLMLLDGYRSIEEVRIHFERIRAPIPMETLDTITRGLLVVGVLEEVESEFSALENLPGRLHECTGCGASCQGHWIGPLEPEFVEKTLTRMAELRKRYPQLGQQRPFMRISAQDNALFLNSESGQCLFLDEHLRCILHLEYGTHEKPTICQMFPYVRLEDGERTRLGISLKCLTHSIHVARPQDEDAADSPGREADPREAWEQMNESLDGKLFHYYPHLEPLGPEEELLERIKEAQDALEMILGELVGAHRRPSRVDAARRLQSIVESQLAAVEADLAADPMMRALCQKKGLYPELACQIRAVARKDPATRRKALPVASAGPAKTVRRLLMINDCLLRFFFLRQYVMFDDLEKALAVFALGIWLSLRLAPEGAPGDERFGEVFAAWMRIVQGRGVCQCLFEQELSARGFLVAFERFWRDTINPFAAPAWTPERG